MLYRQNRQCNENITDCGGKTAVVLPADCPRSVGVAKRKVKVPAIPWVLGLLLQMTYALAVTKGKIHNDAMSLVWQHQYEQNI